MVGVVVGVKKDSNLESYLFLKVRLREGAGNVDAEPWKLSYNEWEDVEWGNVSNGDRMKRLKQ